jgi:uridine kinase
VIYEKLPADIADRYVLVMDPVLSTGGSATRAIEVLLGRGVRQDKILFLCIIAAPEGISRLCSRFPAIKVRGQEEWWLGCLRVEGRGGKGLV